MIELYQIGEVVLDFANEEWHGDNLKADVKATEVYQFGEMLWSDRQYTPNAPVKKLTGKLYAQCGMSKDAQVQRLKGYVGLLIDLIAYTEVSDCCPDFGGNCGDCGGNSNGGEEYLWLHSVGQISEVNVTLNGDYFYELEISISHNPYWEPLNRLLWAYSYSASNPFTTEPGAMPIPIYSALIPYPKSFEVLYNNCKKWVKRRFDNELVRMYDPLVWASLHTTHRKGYPQTGVGYYWTNAIATYAVSSDKAIWSAPPLSAYAFRNITASTDITITVTYQADVWNTTTETLTILQADINAAMAVYGGILANDILIIGEVTTRPGIVIRNDIILGGFYLPQLSTPGFLGNLRPGTNLIEITAPEADIAALHTFRRM